MTEPVCNPCQPVLKPLVTLPAKPHYTNDNSNAITLNIPAPSPQIQGVQTSVQIGPQPLQLRIDTSTDWPAVFVAFFVGIGTIFVAFVVAKISRNTQKNQIKSSIATFRQAWQTDLRKAVIKFIAATTKISYKTKTDPDFPNKELSDDDFIELVQSQGEILLLLDCTKQTTDEMKYLMDEIRHNIRNYNEDSLERSVISFTNKSAHVLEMAWQDIKRDLQ